MNPPATEPSNRMRRLRHPRHLLRELGIQPSRRLGQSFLVDGDVSSRIASLAGPGPGQKLIEIGAGLGCLTIPLAAGGCRLVAIEIDPRMARFLQEMMADHPEVSIICADFLDLELRELAKDSTSRIRVASNLPYKISTEVLFRLLHEHKLFDTFTLMFQKEMACRIVASPGTRDYGILSVSAQMLVDIVEEIRVPGDAFYPRPKVDSVVLHMRVRDEPRFSCPDEVFFRKIVRGAFSHRRKTLANSLACSGLIPLAAGHIARTLESIRIDPRRRAESLDLEEFSVMATAFGRLSNERI